MGRPVQAHAISPGGRDRFKPLATTWIQRISAYPELSTAVEQGFTEVQIAHWAGIHAPTGVLHPVGPAHDERDMIRGVVVVSFDARERHPASQPVAPFLVSPEQLLFYMVSLDQKFMPS